MIQAPSDFSEIFWRNALSGNHGNWPPSPLIGLPLTNVDRTGLGQFGAYEV